MLDKSDAFTASTIPAQAHIPPPKLPTALQAELDSIQDPNSLVIVFVKKFTCDSDTPLEQELKQKINEHPKQFHYYSICYRPHELQFPEVAMDMVYIFEPKAKWFNMMGAAQGFAQHFNQIIETMEKRQEEARKPFIMTAEQEQQQLEMLQKEQLDKFPSVFQQTRNLLKTGWDAAKGLAHGRMLLVSAEVAEGRLKTCESCEHYTEKRCTKCGCWMEQKVHIQASTCPVGKW